jgi:hypothetical protein
MPITIRNTDIAQAFAAKKRIRTMNHRGSLLQSTVTTNGESFGTGNDILNLIPIAFSASVKSIKLGVLTAMTGATCKIGMGGINRDGSVTAIKDDLFKADGGSAGTASAWVELLKLETTDATIYELLCDATTKLPIAEFEPYKNDRYGMMILTVGTAGSAGVAADNPVLFQIEYVEGSPSEAPLTELVINPRATPIT